MLIYGDEKIENKPNNGTHNLVMLNFWICWDHEII